jgi:hypothetical protein
LGTIRKNNLINIFHGAWIMSNLYAKNEIMDCSLVTPLKQNRIVYSDLQAFSHLFKDERKEWKKEGKKW